MNYPRIYSLSTVGLLKHYVHDYLFHPLRTDFIGPNGVGKSIIADLLQLLFVYDTSLIKFGTDGVKKEDRSIYSLPYNVNTGYCFLNLEVKEGHYLTIGIAISSQVSHRIIPFVIASTAELSAEIGQLTLRPDQLLTAKQFVDDGKIPDPKQLAGHLLDRKGLYLTPFRTKDEVKQYYQFLYDKEILSLNLAMDENLQAFAKVIQSFSKAKSLDLRATKASKSLKEFLFEENETEFQQEYYRQQTVLERILRDYQNLNQYIKVLTQMQAKLTDLKKLDEGQQACYKAWKVAEIQATLQERLEWRQKETELMTAIEEDKTEWQRVNQLCDRLPPITTAISEAFERANENLSLYDHYITLVGQLEEQQKQISELKILQAIEVAPGWKTAATPMDMTLRSVADLKDLLQLFQHYQRRYQRYEAVEETYHTQQKTLSEKVVALGEQKKKLTTLISILENKSENSVLGWILQHPQPLSAEQRQIILHYATVATEKDPSPKKGDRFADVAGLLQASFQRENATGFWIKLGPMHEFLPDEKEADMLEEAKPSLSIETWLQSLRADLQELLTVEKELAEIAKGKAYDNSLVDDIYDPFLMVYANIENLREAMLCAQQLDAKMVQLTAEHKATKGSYDRVKKGLPKNIRYHEPEVVRRELKDITTRCLNRIRRFARYSERVENQQKILADRLQDQRSSLTDVMQSVLHVNERLTAQQSAYFVTFGEPYPEEEWPTQQVPLSQRKEEYIMAQQNYQVAYRDTVNSFDETRNNANIDVNAQIQTGEYSFNILERALLGIKVRHTDDIAAALADANRNRLSMADELKTSMVRIFENTVIRYRQHQLLVKEVNAFFQGRKISDRFYFSIDFAPHEHLRIELVEEIGARMRQAARQGELPFEQHVSVFIEEFFQKAARLKQRPPIDHLLNPTSYFELAVRLTDDKGTEVPGSTGETYSAIALLGIARLSIVQKKRRNGLRFIILEELGSLDSSNFNTFPAIAKEFSYQIITMAPTPFRTALADEWYAHHLIKGIGDKDINYAPTASYFKTAHRSVDLETYLSRQKNELDRVEGPA